MFLRYKVIRMVDAWVANLVDNMHEMKEFMLAPARPNVVLVPPPKEPEPEFNPYEHKIDLKSPSPGFVLLTPSEEPRLYRLLDETIRDHSLEGQINIYAPIPGNKCAERFLKNYREGSFLCSVETKSICMPYYHFVEKMDDDALRGSFRFLTYKIEHGHSSKTQDLSDMFRQGAALFAWLSLITTPLLLMGPAAAIPQVTLASTACCLGLAYIFGAHSRTAHLKGDAAAAEYSNGEKLFPKHNGVSIKQRVQDLLHEVFEPFMSKPSNSSRRAFVDQIRSEKAAIEGPHKPLSI